MQMFLKVDAEVTVNLLDPHLQRPLLSLSLPLGSQLCIIKKEDKKRILILKSPHVQVHQPKFWLQIGAS